MACNRLFLCFIFYRSVAFQILAARHAVLVQHLFQKLHPYTVESGVHIIYLQVCGLFVTWLVDISKRILMLIGT